MFKLSNAAAYLFVPHNSGGEFGLGLGEAGAGAAVHAVNLQRQSINQSLKQSKVPLV